MEISMTRHPMLYAAMQRIANPNYTQEEEAYECSICKDSNYIAVRDDGVELPLRDVQSSRTKLVRKCICLLKKDIEASIAHSNIDPTEYARKSFRTFKIDSDEAQKMYDLAQRFICEEANGVGFFGKSGAGKTHICIAICNELAQKGISHRYFSYRTDIQRLKSMQNDFNQIEEYNKLLNRFKQAKVLYIDDLLKLSKNNKGDIDSRELQIVYDILNDRYLNGRKIIISSEYSVSEITKIDEAIGGRIFEMIGDNGLKITGPNRRFMR